MNKRNRMMQRSEGLLDKHVHYLQKQILKKVKDPLETMFLIAEAAGKSHSAIENIKFLKEELK